MNGEAILRFSPIPANGVELHVAEAGPPDGPLVILLHGFPEFWFGWRHQIAPLAESGFHVVAPDQRGYNLSAKPRDAAAYDLDLLAADVLGLADHFGQHDFAIAGHDWGASVGWWLAGTHPQRVRRLAVLNAPHPAVWLDAMQHLPAQRQKSRYVRFFKLPYLPEFLLGLNHYAALAKGFRDAGFPPEDLQRYRTAWSQPGALTAMLNWYRALLDKPLQPPAAYRITCPTLLIWGMRDVYAEPELADASLRLCSSGRMARLEQSTHWVQHDEPERVAGLLIDFLRS